MRHDKLANELNNEAALQARRDETGSAHRVRVLIVDDSLTVRTVFSRMIAEQDELDLVGTASNAERALAILRDKPVDVLLLDLEMPGMGGLKALPQMLKTREKLSVLVISSLTADGAEHSIEAMAMGAADTMLKPRPGDFNEAYRDRLIDRIRALGGIDRPRKPAQSGAVSRRRDHQTKPPRVIAFGASTGGIHALNVILRALPKSIDLPIVITQHLPASFVPVFARQIETVSGRKCTIAGNYEGVTKGQIVIADAHGHLELRQHGERLCAHISTRPARSGCVPSVDPMLASLADEIGGAAIAVILSGMGRDGCEGAARLAAAGGTIIVQDRESSAVWGMPGAVAEAGLANAILPPEAIAPAIAAAIGAAACE